MNSDKTTMQEELIPCSMFTVRAWAHMQASVSVKSGKGILKQPVGVISVLLFRKIPGQRHYKVRGGIAALRNSP